MKQALAPTLNYIGKLGFDFFKFIQNGMIVCGMILLPILCFAQISQNANRANIKALQSTVSQPNSPLKTDSLARFWYQSLATKGSFPLFVSDTAHFYWYAPASVSSVHFQGEWEQLWHSGLAAPPTKAARINQTNLWHLALKLPPGSLFEYQILEDKLARYDSGNRHKGCNAKIQTISYAIMTGYAPAYPLPLDVPVARGNVSEAMFVSSNVLSTPIRYWVYTPPDYEGLKNLPAVYILQGQNFLMPCAANMPYVFDQLIGNQVIAPCVAVFIDSRLALTKNEPDQAQNWLAANPVYLDFLQNELVPAVERDFLTAGPASKRALMGAGIGGLFSSWSVALRPETFSMAAAIYPDFSYFPQIYEIFEQSDLPANKFFMASASGYESVSSVLKLKEILKTKPTRLQYIQTSAGTGYRQVQPLAAGALLMFFPK